jgi:hypothetical protein
MIGHIDAGRKGAIARPGNHRNLCPYIFDLRPRFIEFIQHLDIDHIQRRAIQDNARNARAGMKPNR